MNLKVLYKGDTGKGSVRITVPGEIDFVQLISAFHKTTGIPETYTISGGAPPHRRKITVFYSYLISVNGKVINDFKQHLNEVPLNENDIVEITVGGGGRVD